MVESPARFPHAAASFRTEKPIHIVSFAVNP